MSSQRRIQSSRANGAKSRGPVTPAGRKKSSQNNLRHGLLSEAVVLDEENPDAFFELLANLTREHNPQTETQRVLVETMAAARWRLTRLWAIERETLQAEIQKHDPADHGAAARAALAFRGLADQGRTLDILNRHESRLDRQYARSLNLLMKLAAPDSPLTQFLHTNPVPQSDSAAHAEPDSIPSRQPMLAGPSEVNQAASLPLMPSAPTHAEPACSVNPDTPVPDPASEESQVAGDAQAIPGPDEIGLAVCGTPVPHPAPGGEVASLTPYPSAASESPTHAESTCSVSPCSQPLTPDPASQPALQSQDFQLSRAVLPTPYPSCTYISQNPLPLACPTPDSHPPHGRK